MSKIWKVLSCSAALVSAACGNDSNVGQDSDGASLTGGGGSKTDDSQSDGPDDGSVGAGAISGEGSASGEGSTQGQSTGGAAQGSGDGSTGGAGDTDGSGATASGGDGQLPGAGGQGLASGGSGSGAPGAGGAAALPPGCGITQRVDLTDAPERRAAISLASRVAGEFAIGPWAVDVQPEERSLHWLRVDLEAGTQRAHSPVLPASGNIANLNMAPPNRIVFVSGNSAATGVYYVDEDADSYTMGDTFWDDKSYSGLFPSAAGVSLDGERGLVMVSVGGARLSMFSTAAETVGELVEIADLGDCPAMLPTEHGVVYSERVANTLSLREFGPAGDIIRTLSVSLDDGGGCPMLALDGDGFAVLEAEYYILHRISADGSDEVERWRGLKDTSTVGFAVDGDSAIALTFIGQTPTVVRLQGGQDSFYPLDIDTSASPMSQISSEAGKLFVLVNPLRSSSNTISAIIEIECID